MDETTRCGFAALIGATNVGKSTLVNALVGHKVAIVTPKAQTTRALLRGIAVDGRAQIILVDTPGLFAPRRRLDRAMVASAWSGAGDADVICMMIDAAHSLPAEAPALFERITELRQPKALVLNKVDLVDKPSLLTLARDINARATFAASMPLRAASIFASKSSTCF